MLDRKLLRDLAQMKSQALTIALVVATGIGAFISMLSTYDSLQWQRETYYREARFAHAFARLKRAPLSLEGQIAQLPGVAEVETAVVFDVTLDLSGVAEPVTGRMIGLNDGGLPRLNRLFLRQGRMPEAGRGNEVLVAEAFARARKLKPGDRLTALLNGRREALYIVGVVLSPEYIFSARMGTLPDDKGFGVFWMARERLASAFDMEGAFNQAALRLTPGAHLPAVVAALDRLLDPYGGLGAHGRDEQASHRILSQEIRQQKIMSTILPGIFLGVAVFLLNVVLSRQVATQREQIAALKALGYADFAIAAHYLKLVLVIVALGIAGGVALGAWLGHYMTAMYTDFFHFPRRAYRVAPWIALLACGISLAAALAAALGTVYRIARLPPAEAMRPPAPLRYRRMLLERLGLVHWISPQARMVVRTLERRPLRTLLTSFGIACSVAVIISGTFWRDALDYMIAVQFNSAERADASVVFTEPLARGAMHEIAQLPGVLKSEGTRGVPVRLHAGHRSYLTALSGFSEGAELRRLLDADLRVQPLPGGGVLLTDRLAAKLGVQAGDKVWLEALEGRRVKREVTVAGLVNDMIGLSAYMESGALNRLLGEGDVISGAAVTLERPRAQEFYARLKDLPRVATVAVKDALLRSFREVTAKNVLFFTAVVTVCAGAIAVGVVYNSARIALAERAWELASLRVLGFTRREVSAFLLGELLFELAAAIPLGLWLGYLLAWGITSVSHTETFFIPLVIYPATYAYAAAAIAAAGLVSALIVRHRVDHLDLVAVLKIRE